jgi:hypothetical protein
MYSIENHVVSSCVGAVTVLCALPVSSVVFGNYTYTTHMPLQNESKHNDNWIKHDNPKQKH